MDGRYTNTNNAGERKRHKQEQTDCQGLVEEDKGEGGRHTWSRVSPGGGLLVRKLLLVVEPAEGDGKTEQGERMRGIGEQQKGW